MENKETRARLEDVINYEPEKYMTDEDLALIRSAFKGNQKLLNALRKVFFPTIYDAQLPVEQFGADAFNAGRDWASMPAEEAKILITARQDAMHFIMGGLIKLKTLSNMVEESATEAALRREKNSSQ